MLFGFSWFDVVLFGGIGVMLLVVMVDGVRKRVRRSSGFTDTSSSDGGWFFSDFGGGWDCGDGGGDCGGGDGGGGGD